MSLPCSSSQLGYHCKLSGYNMQLWTQWCIPGAGIKMIQYLPHSNIILCNSDKDDDCSNEVRKYNWFQYWYYIYIYIYIYICLAFWKQYYIILSGLGEIDIDQFWGHKMIQSTYFNESKLWTNSIMIFRFLVLSSANKDYNLQFKMPKFHMIPARKWVRIYTNGVNTCPTPITC
jgi:hypothetical protein